MSVAGVLSVVLGVLLMRRTRMPRDVELPPPLRAYLGQLCTLLADDLIGLGAEWEGGDQ